MSDHDPGAASTGQPPAPLGPIVSWQAGPDGESFTAISPEVALLLGYTPEQLVGRPGLWCELVHPEDRDLLTASARHVLPEQGVGLAEHRVLLPQVARFRHRDGTYRWVLVEIEPAVEPAADPAVLTGTLLDVTEVVQGRLHRALYWRLAHAATREPNPDAVLPLVLRELVHFTGGSRGVIARSAGAGTPLVPLHTVPASGYPADLAPRTLARSLVRKVLAARETALGPPEPEPGGTDPLGPRPLRLGICVPLLQADRLLGVLLIEREWSAPELADHDLAAVEIVAGFAAAALVGLERLRLEGLLIASRVAVAALSRHAASLTAALERAGDEAAGAYPARVAAQIARDVRRLEALLRRATRPPHPTPRASSSE